MSDSKNMFYGATQEIFDRAKELRNNMTDAEGIVWNYLSNNQLGLRFRRQHPISRYIADFYCHSKKVIIEIDGSVHNSIEQQVLDKEREVNLQEFGLRIIRFSNNEVLVKPDEAIAKIKEFIN